MKTSNIWTVRLKWTVRQLKRRLTHPSPEKRKRLIRLALKGFRLLILALKLLTLIRELFRMIARSFQAPRRADTAAGGAFPEGICHAPPRPGMRRIPRAVSGGSALRDSGRGLGRGAGRDPALRRLRPCRTPPGTPGGSRGGDKPAQRRTLLRRDGSAHPRLLFTGRGSAHEPRRGPRKLRQYPALHAEMELITHKQIKI